MIAVRGRNVPSRVAPRPETAILARVRSDVAPRAGRGPASKGGGQAKGLSRPVWRLARDNPWRSAGQVVAGMPNSEHLWSVVKLVSVKDVPGTSAWSCSVVASKRGQNGVTNVFGLLNQANWVQ